MTNKKQKINNISCIDFLDFYEKGYNDGFLSALQSLKDAMITNNKETINIKTIIHYITFYKSNFKTHSKETKK